MEIFTDGACSGNPGEAGIGVVFKASDGSIVKEISRSIGPATNNVAEYSALVCALQEALVMKLDEVTVFTDSELMHRQVTGIYKVKDEKIKILFDQVQHLISGFNCFMIHHVRRHLNKEADQLATQAIKNKQAKVVAPLFKNSGEESPSSEG